MTLVIDASVTMAWCFEDEATPETDAILDRLGEEPAMVAELWHLEVVNVLLVAERRNRINEAQAAHFLELLAQLPIRAVDSPSSSDAILAAAGRHRLSAYSAAYLVLAERHAAQLATLDVRLATAARTAGLTVLPQTGK